MKLTHCWMITVVALVAACGPARRSEPLTGPFVAAEPTLARGEALFDRHCDRCHTGGEAALGPGLNDKPLPTFLMRFQVRHGLGAMPGFSEREISDEDLDALLAYSKALRRQGS